MPYHGIGKCRDKCMHLFTYCTLLGVVVYFAFRIAEGLIINIFCYCKYDLYQYSDLLKSFDLGAVYVT